MKKLSLLFSLCPVFLWGQVEMNFENGLPAGLEQFPAGRWGVSEQDPIQGSYSLRHVFDNAQSSIDILSFPIAEPDTDSSFLCSFVIRYEYSPSGSNNWCYYIFSEVNGSNTFTNPVNKFLSIGVNQTGTDDSLWIYQQMDGKMEKLLNCKLHCENDIGTIPWLFRIQYVVPDVLLVEGGPFPGNIKELGRLSGWSMSSLKAGFGGLAYQYTSSKDRLLTIDSIYYSYDHHTDSIAPVLVNMRVFSPLRLEMEFSEQLYLSDPDEFFLKCSTKIDTYLISGNFLYVDLMEAPQNNTEIAFQISGLSDRQGNVSLVSANFVFYYPAWHDLLFTEVMPDPSPPVYLPETEYVEVYNRSAYPLNLKGWKLLTGNREWILPEAMLGPGEYHFFCHGDAYLNYSEQKRYSSIFSSSSVLSNDGQRVALYTADNVLIDAFEYSISWYSGDYKSEGGWSLERIDPGNLCGGREIWRPSEDLAGGTPGEMNSRVEIVPDHDPPFIQQVIYVSDSTYLLRFNETIDIQSFAEVMSEILWNNESILSLQLAEPFFRECSLQVDKNSRRHEFVFTSNWRDCSSNVSGFTEKIICAPPVNVSPGEVLITEILFSPWPGCPEFVELYNNSQNVLSLSDLQIAVNSPGQPSISGKMVSEEKILFYPSTYLVLSRDPSLLKVFYDVPARMNAIQMTGLPSLTDAGARIAIFSRGNVLIDEVVYSTEEHFPLLSDSHGVSLERVNITAEPGIMATWHSASSLSGYATPGYRNSQFVENSETKSDFSVEEKIFTPNNDGVNDLAVFHLKMDREGYVAMIRVFDANGILRKILGRNELLGRADSFYWDGRDDAGVLCETGIYLVHLEAYHLSGSRRKLKQTVVLGRQ